MVVAFANSVKAATSNRLKSDATRLSFFYLMVVVCAANYDVSDRKPKSSFFVHKLMIQVLA